MSLNVLKWGLLDWLNNSVYAVQGVAALLGLYHVVVCLFRISQKQFRTLAAQDQFLDELGQRLQEKNFDAAVELCSGDQRALCQLAELGILNRDLGYGKVRQLLLDRFQRDVLSDLEHRITWINTVVKSAPMIGLLGTVMGMVQAFQKLGAATTVEPTELASSIGLALYTTAIGLVIAVPLIVCMSAINIRIRKMEDSVGNGLTRFFDMFRQATQNNPEPRFKK